MYLFIFLNPADEFLGAFHIDDVICAEFFTIKTDFTGKHIRIVTLVMLYSLCKKINLHSPCINNT